MNPSSPLILGLMSGTSLDGLDLALCSFIETDGQWQHTIHIAETYPYHSIWLSRLKSAASEDGEGLALLHAEYGQYLGQQSNHFLKKHKQKADYISSHGHTVFHRPDLGLTLQIGSGAAISGSTGIPVICDFRTQDVAMGGQGAPLVPIGDELLFRAYDYCLNLGGFSNISYHQAGKRLAFDIGPCNLVFNALASRLDCDYDEGGKIAATGTLNEELLHRLDALAHYEKTGPKSLGREWVETEIMPMLDDFSLPVPDLMRTLVEHVSSKIAEATAIIGNGKVLVTGGGARNTFLLERIRTKTTSQLIIPGDLTLDFKEALIFAFLGLLRVQERNNILSSVTGSSSDHCGGCLYLP